jgi:hypothetical protein
MKHNIIQTENYLVIAEDSKINVGDYGVGYAHGINGQGEEWFLFFHDDSIKARLNVLCEGSIKVIAHLPLGNHPVLDKVDLLPPIENEVEELAEDYSKKHSIYETAQDDVFHGFVQGYNKAKERYKWTDEDVIRIVEKSRDTGLTAEYLILSLQQPKMPVGFECEMINCDKCVYVQGGDLSPDCCNELKPKTTTNSQGIQWVGKYIFG